MSSPVSPLGFSIHDLDVSASYSVAFPPLQPIPLSLPHQPKRTQHAHQPPPALQAPLVPPKYPSYLKQTLYADLVLEQYNLRQSRRSHWAHDHLHPRPHDLTPECRPLAAGRLPSTSSLLPLSVPVEDLDLRLPSFWNRQARSRYIEAGRNGLDLSYNGPGKTEQHAAAIRANHPMRPQCGVYYYEMHVLSKGTDGYITIGFSGVNTDIERVPGYQSDTWGYQGDSGDVYAGSTRGSHYGPGFTTGDTIGCGVNFANGTAFYTKNGSFLGVAFENLDRNAEYYPCVGLRTPGERVTVNFGNEPFVYDISQYIKDQKLKAWEEIASRSLTGARPGPGAAAAAAAMKRGRHSIRHSPHRREQDVPEKSDELVLSYLVRQGYLGTAKAMIKDTKYTCDKNLQTFSARDRYTSEADLQRRSNIRMALAHGEVDQAIRMTQQHYPMALQQQQQQQQDKSDGDDIVFELKCRKFIEMIHEYSERERQLFQRDGEMLENDQASITSNGSSAHMQVPNSPDDDQSSHHPLQQQQQQQQREQQQRLSHCHSHPFELPVATMAAPEENTAWTRDRRRSTSGSLTNHSTASAIRVPGRRRMSYAAIAASASPSSGNGFSCGLSASPPGDDPAAQHDHDDYTHPLFTSRRHHRRASTRRSSTCSTVLSVGSLPGTVATHEESEHDLSEVDEADEASAATSMRRIMDYGQKLQTEYRSDERVKVRARLVEIFSLLAYPDVKASPVAHLMDKAGRDELATRLNAAILGRHDMSALERIYRQVLLANRELAYAGDGQSAIVNVEEYCAEPSHPANGGASISASES